jgi:hypothetical protein
MASWMKVYMYEESGTSKVDAVTARGDLETWNAKKHEILDG